MDCQEDDQETDSEGKSPLEAGQYNKVRGMPQLSKVGRFLQERPEVTVAQGKPEFAAFQDWTNCQLGTGGSGQQEVEVQESAGPLSGLKEQELAGRS